MNSVRRLRFVHLVIFFTSVLAIDAGRVLISQVLKGKTFGSPFSTDIAKRIVVDNEGFLYIGGNTKPLTPDQDPWGEVEAGDVTGKTDIFVAKVSATGELIWVLRSGSREDDFLNDMKITNNSLYICGTTEGDFGNQLNGSMDAFLMKITPHGEKAWNRPLQFGSSGNDTCNSLDVDTGSGAIFAVGSTSGVMFRSYMAASGKLHHYTVKFRETTESPGFELVKGRQRGAHGSSSGESIVVANKYLYFMSRTSGERSFGNYGMKTYLSILDRDTLFMHQMHVLQSRIGDSFRGVKMIVQNKTGDAYIIGEGLSTGGTKGFYVLKVGSAANDKYGGIVWDTLLGETYDKDVLLHQELSIAADFKNEKVYVAGTEDGVYQSRASHNSGLVVSPFFKLNMKDGKIEERWHRTTSMPSGGKEVTDIAIDAGGTVIYTGVSYDIGNRSENVWMGWFGSQKQVSAMGLRRQSADHMGVNSNKGSDEDDMPSIPSRGMTATVLILCIAGLGILFIVFAVKDVQASKRKRGIVDSEAGEGDDDGMQKRREEAKVEFKKSSMSDSAILGASVGGSGLPE